MRVFQLLLLFHMYDIELYESILFHRTHALFLSHTHTHTHITAPRSYRRLRHRIVLKICKKQLWGDFQGFFTSAAQKNLYLDSTTHITLHPKTIHISVWGISTLNPHDGMWSSRHINTSVPYYPIHIDTRVSAAGPRWFRRRGGACHVHDWWSFVWVYCPFCTYMLTQMQSGVCHVMIDWVLCEYIVLSIPTCWHKCKVEQPICLVQTYINTCMHVCAIFTTHACGRRGRSHGSYIHT